MKLKQAQMKKPIKNWITMDEQIETINKEIEIIKRN